MSVKGAVLGGVAATVLYINMSNRVWDARQATAREIGDIHASLSAPHRLTQVRAPTTAPSLFYPSSEGPAAAWGLPLTPASAAGMRCPLTWSLPAPHCAAGAAGAVNGCI